MHNGEIQKKKKRCLNTCVCIQGHVSIYMHMCLSVYLQYIPCLLQLSFFINLSSYKDLMLSLSCHFCLSQFNPLSNNKHKTVLPVLLLLQLCPSLTFSSSILLSLYILLMCSPFHNRSLSLSPSLSSSLPPSLCIFIWHFRSLSLMIPYSLPYIGL